MTATASLDTQIQVSNFDRSVITQIQQETGLGPYHAQLFYEYRWKAGRNLYEDEQTLVRQMERQLARKKAEAAIPLRTNDNGYNPSPQAKAPPPPEAKINEPLPPLDLSNWDLAEVPERDWAVRDRIIRRAVTLLSGEGGVGKSILTLQLACATVLGKDWFGSLPEPGPAIFLDAEDDRDELHFRLNTIRRRLGVTFKDLADEGLHLRAGALAGAGWPGEHQPAPR